jgi:hypothetical protein
VRSAVSLIDVTCIINEYIKLYHDQSMEEYNFYHTHIGKIGIDVVRLLPKFV